MGKCTIGAIYNKSTNELVHKEFYNKPIKEVVDVVGEPLKIIFEDDLTLLFKEVVNHDQTDYGFWVETIYKNWRFDWI